MGSADRTIRILVAIAIAVLFFTHSISGTWTYILLTLASIFLVTSCLSVCPLYSVLGLNTCKRKSD